MDFQLSVHHFHIGLYIALRAVNGSICLYPQQVAVTIVADAPHALICSILSFFLIIQQFAQFLNIRQRFSKLLRHIL